MKRLRLVRKRKLTTEILISLAAAIMFFAIMYAGYVLGKMTYEQPTGDVSTGR